MRIYTGKGDKGDTTLAGGKKARKSDPRIAALGSVDELNAAVGVALAFLEDRKVEPILRRVQGELFSLGAELAAGKPAKPITSAHVAALERDVAKYEPDYNGAGFVLPSGAKSAALLHLARAIARRAERNVVRLKSRTALNPETATYLNRLSSLLFILAIHENKFQKVAERHPSYGAKK